MQIAQELSGFTAGEADILRRAMGKKKRLELEKQKERFVNGAVKNGITKDTAIFIFTKIEPFAEYGFNKSHAAAYAMIAYQTAYLKTYYPNEFIAASMSTELSNTDKLSEFFIKNDILYFTCFRFIGGGGAPYAIQNVLPILFDMTVKNYVIATFVGSTPSMFITVALGSGIENVIDQNASLSITTVLFSPEIYIPIIAFFIILIIALLIKKYYFKQ